MVRHEEDFSSEQQEEEQDSRLPHPDAHDGRSERSQAPTPSRTAPPGRVKGPRASRFEEIYQNGSRTNSQFVRLIVLEGTGFVGVTTSKGLGCRARRNRAKRRAKEAWSLAGLCPDWDVVLAVKASADRIPFSDLASDVLRASQEARKAWNRS